MPGLFVPSHRRFPKKNLSALRAGENPINPEKPAAIAREPGHMVKKCFFCGSPRAARAAGVSNFKRTEKSAKIPAPCTYSAPALLFFAFSRFVQRPQQTRTDGLCSARLLPPNAMLCNEFSGLSAAWEHRFFMFWTFWGGPALRMTGAKQQQRPNAPFAFCPL